MSLLGSLTLVFQVIVIAIVMSRLLPEIKYVKVTVFNEWIFLTAPFVIICVDLFGVRYCHGLGQAHKQYLHPNSPTWRKIPVNDTKKGHDMNSRQPQIIFCLQPTMCLCSSFATFNDE